MKQKYGSVPNIRRGEERVESVQNVSENASLHFALSAPLLSPVPLVHLRSIPPPLLPHLPIRFLSSPSPEAVVVAITLRHVPPTPTQSACQITSKPNRRCGSRDL